MVLSRAFSIERPKQGGERARDKSDCRRKREGPPRVLADIAGVSNEGAMSVVTMPTNTAPAPHWAGGNATITR